MITSPSDDNSTQYNILSCLYIYMRGILIIGGRGLIRWKILSSSADLSGSFSCILLEDSLLTNPYGRVAMPDFDYVALRDLSRFAMAHCTLYIAVPALRIRTRVQNPDLASKPKAYT